MINYHVQYCIERSCKVAELPNTDSLCDFMTSRTKELFNVFQFMHLCISHVFVYVLDFDNVEEGYILEGNSESILPSSIRHPQNR
jgi:hypothetical protein